METNTSTSVTPIEDAGVRSSPPLRRLPQLYEPDPCDSGRCRGHRTPRFASRESVMRMDPAVPTTTPRAKTQ